MAQSKVRIYTKGNKDTDKELLSISKMLDSERLNLGFVNANGTRVYSYLSEFY